jgi:hypothetical protein
MPESSRAEAGTARSWPAVLAFLAATLLLAGAAIHNGYPFVHWDTGTYVSSSFTFEVPLRRPIAYGLFLAATHLGVSLWMVVLAQAAILTALIRGVLAPSPRRDTALLAIVAGLTVFTSLPWFTSQIMPDVFAGACALSLFFLLRRPPRSRAMQIALGAALVLSSAVHHSHLPLAVGLVVAAQVAKLVRPRLELALLPAWIAVASAAILVPSVNFLLTGQLFYTKAAHAFVLGRIVGNGLMDKFLAEHCENGDYSLCPYRDELRPRGSSFLWDRASSFHRTGGWTAPAAPTWRMIGDSILSDPGAHLRAAGYNTLRQLGLFHSGGLPPYGPNEYVSRMVRARFPDEASSYTESRQQRSTLVLDALAPLHFWAAWASAVLSVALLVAGARGARLPALDLHLFAWTALVLNAAIMSNLSAVTGRYQGRVVWLLVLATLVTATERWLARSVRSERARGGEASFPLAPASRCETYNERRFSRRSRDPRRSSARCAS